MSRATARKVRTTVSLPDSLLDFVDELALRKFRADREANDG